MKTITIEITPKGEVSIEATGFKGNACEKATREIEKALGEVKSAKKKPEWFAATNATQGIGGRS